MSEPVTALDACGVQPRETLRIEDRGPVGQVTLKGRLDDPALRAAVEAETGVAVPGALGAAFGPDGRGAVWMAPDELLLFCAYDRAGAAVAALSAALAGTHNLALDVSDARAVLALTGPDVGETLAKGMPVDFSEAAFPVGRARRSQLSGIAVAVWRRAPEHWEIVCLRSYAHHLMDWLAASGAAGARVGRF